MATVTAKKGNWYYILIVALTFLMMFVGTQTSAGFSIMVNAVRESMGLTGAQSSAIFTVKNLSAFIFVFFATKYYEKLGLRLGVTLAFVYGIIAMVIFSMAGDNIMIVYVAAVVLGAAYAFTMMLPMALIIRRWFNKSRALAMSVCAAGTGLSSFVLSPIVQGVINSQGTSAAFVTLAVCFAVVAVIFFLGMRNDPSDVGLEPYGGYDYVEAGKSGKKKAAVMKTNEKVVMAIITMACIIGVICPPAQSHFVMQFRTLGYDSMVAASAYSICGLALVISKLGLGVLSEKFNFGTLSVIFLAVMGISFATCFAMGFTGIINWLPFMVTSLYGISGAICGLGYTNWMADFTTRDDYAVRIKNAQFAYQGGEIVGSLIPGLILDATGQYSGYYGIGAICTVGIILVVAKAYAGLRKQGYEEINGEKVAM